MQLKKCLPFFSFCLVTLVAFSFAGCGNSAGNKVPFEIKKGTQLIFAVESGADAYDFTVDILSAGDGLSFNWNMTPPANASGKVTITADALKTARTFNNYFTDGSDLTFTDMSTVFLTDIVIQDLVKDKKASTQLDLGDGMQDYEAAPGMAGEMEVKVDGKNQKLNYNVIYGKGNSYQLNYIELGPYYLIAEMKTDFSIKLKEVKE